MSDSLSQLEEEDSIENRKATSPQGDVVRKVDDEEIEIEQEVVA